MANLLSSLQVAPPLLNEITVFINKENGNYYYKKSDNTIVRMVDSGNGIFNINENFVISRVYNLTGEETQLFTTDNYALTLKFCCETQVVQGPSGSSGSRGPAGADGPQGPQGPPGLLENVPEGEIVFGSATNEPTFSPNLYFDVTSVHLGIGTNTPTASVHIVGQTADNTENGLAVYDLAEANLNFSVRNDGRVNSRLGYWVNDILFSYFGNQINSNVFTVGGNNNVTGVNNDVYGKNAGIALTTGFQNSLFGTSAGELNADGLNITAFGYRAAQQGVSAFNVTAVGSSAGFENTGNRNIFIGTGSGTDSITGENLIFIGDNSSVDVNGHSNSVAIGRLSVIQGSNQFVTGSPTVRYNDYYFGAGVTEVNAQGSISLKATSIQEGTADVSAALNAFNIDGSQGTGTGLGGDIVFRTAAPGASSNLRNPLADVAIVRGDTDTNFEIVTTTGALIVSRLTTVERDALSTFVDGMIIYNTTLGKFQGFEAAAWVNLV